MISRLLSIFSKLLFSLVFLFSLIGPARAQEELQSKVPSKAASALLPSIEELKGCLKTIQAAECLDKLYNKALKNNSTFDALKQIQQLEAQDPELRRDCHPIVHAIGRETFRVKGTIHESFAACDQTCHSGCYHGSVERFLRGEDIYSEADRHPSEAELSQKAAVACDPSTPLRLRFQCLHGLGHALLFFSVYNLQQSLNACDGLSDDWSRNSCYGGVFMENVSNSTNEKKNFSPTDYHAPCDQVADKYRRECYIMQTSRMTEMGLNTERILEECGKAGAYRIPCTQSIGRDLSNEARVGRNQTAAQKCELVQGEVRLACMRGAVYALVDNTWDGRYAMPFCAAFSTAADRENCFTMSIQYLHTVFDKSADEISKDCARYAANAPRCLELASR